MSGFSPDWLALREAADAAARSARLDSRLEQVSASRRSAGDVLEVVDLGAGTGANLRYLAPRLGGRQAWRLVDDDPAVLAAVEPSVGNWAGSRDLACRVDPDGRLRLTGPRLDCEFVCTPANLAAGLDALELPPRGLVTASALLDLVSAAWLDALAARCADAESRVLFALSYDGRMQLEPHEPDDERVRELVNRHQLTDKGFGPALGPNAFAAAVHAFAQHGYALRFESSDWRLGPDGAPLQRALIDGWHAAAVELAPGERAELDGWRRTRIAHVAEGRSRVAVGHVDIAGAPARGRG